MKKILTLIMLMLLSITTVDAQNFFLRFSSSNGNSTNLGTVTGSIPKVGDDWVYTCKGSDLSSNVNTSNNRLYVRPRVDYGDGVNDYYRAEEEYASGSSLQFWKYGDTSGRSAYIVMPSDYADYEFTFTLHNYTRDHDVYMTVSWEKSTPEAIQLKSTVDLWHGTDYDSVSDGEYTWTWTKSQLSGITDGSTIQFQLFNPEVGGASGTWYGPKNSDYDMDNLSENAKGTTVHVKTTDGVPGGPKIHAWKRENNTDTRITSNDYPGDQMTETDGVGNYVMHFDESPINIIINRNGDDDKIQFLKVSGDVYFTYNKDNTPKATQGITESLYHDAWYWETANSGNNFFITYNKGNTYTIKAKKNGDQWSVKIITNEQDHDYYWVSPQVTNNQKWEYFKMVPSRNRSGSFGDGKISDKYFSFTIKDSDLKKWDGTALNEGDDIKWYVVRDDEKKWFRPVNDIDNGNNIGEKPRPAGNSGVRADFYSYNYEDCGTTTSRTGHFIFEKGTNVSYTFILNAKPSSGSGNLFVDSPDPETIAAAHLPGVDDNGYEYYLIGNFNSASEAEYISVTNTNHPMTKLWYVGSTKCYYDPGEPCDSIVYECSVSKPNGGWGNLYLDINPARVTDWSNENELGPQYRPLISLGNVLDGRALVGGLTRYNSNQSLNPEPSEFYTGYTFRFNATTMTYHLEFHTSLYLVGDGVTAKDDNNNTLGGTWNLGAANALIPLKSTQEDRHFRNTVTFVNGAVSGTDNTGKGFRFLLTEDESENRTYARNWGENGNAPRYTSLGVNDPHYAGNDTQYRNYLQYNEGNSSTDDPTDDGSNDIIFDLPDGTYVINFYDFGDKSYYTIEREAELRDFNDVVYKGTKRNILGRGETSTTNNGTTTYDFTNAYKFFRVWSDYIAWYKPDDVDVFVVSDFTPSGNHAATVTLTKQDATYIPAKTGVILAMKTDKNSLKGGMRYAQIPSSQESTNTAYNNAWMQMTPYVEPGKDDITLPENKESLLLPLYESTALTRYETSNNNEYANYLFGFYRANKVVANYSGDNEDFLLGFWQTTGAGTTYANSAFLQITRALADQLGVGASYTVSENGQNAPAFMLSFEDPIDPTVTGIVDVDKDVTSPTYKAVNDNWYTIEGVRISAPTTKGIYIHGGKKVIVR